MSCHLISGGTSLSLLLLIFRNKIYQLLRFFFVFCFVYFDLYVPRYVFFVVLLGVFNLRIDNFFQFWNSLRHHLKYFFNYTFVRTFQCFSFISYAIFFNFHSFFLYYLVWTFLLPFFHQSYLLLILSDILVIHSVTILIQHGKLGPSQIFKANKIIQVRKKHVKFSLFAKKCDCIYRKSKWHYGHTFLIKVNVSGLLKTRSL